MLCASIRIRAIKCGFMFISVFTYLGHLRTVPLKPSTMHVIRVPSPQSGVKESSHSCLLELCKIFKRALDKVGGGRVDCTLTALPCCVKSSHEKAGVHESSVSCDEGRDG